LRQLNGIAVWITDEARRWRQVWAGQVEEEVEREVQERAAAALGRVSLRGYQAPRSAKSEEARHEFIHSAFVVGSSKIGDGHAEALLRFETKSGKCPGAVRQLRGDAGLAKELAKLVVEQVEKFGVRLWPASEIEDAIPFGAKAAAKEN
jgi:hypothetical protein